MINHKIKFNRTTCGKIFITHLKNHMNYTMQWNYFCIVSFFSLIIMSHIYNCQHIFAINLQVTTHFQIKWKVYT